MPAPQRGDLQEVKALLQHRVLDLAQTLAPDGWRAGKYWMARNPARNDDKPGSFWIIIHGRDLGVWKDEAVMDRAADVVALIANCKFHDPRRVKEALEWARDWLGMARISPETKARIKHEATERAAKSDKQRAAELAENRRYALSRWLKGGALPGTIAETYFASRGIHLSSLPRVPGALRFFPQYEHRNDETGELTDWPLIMAMVSPSDPASAEKILAVHRTWLAADGIGAAHPKTRGKAPVEPNRRIWPSFSGGVIKLARGDGGLSVKDAIAKGHKTRLLMGEGIETCLSHAVADHSLRVHAYMSVGNIASITVPVDCVSEVILLRENDEGRQAKQQFDNGAAAIAAQGVPVRIARSHIGSDSNDALTGNANRKG